MDLVYYHAESKVSWLTQQVKSKFLPAVTYMYISQLYEQIDGVAMEPLMVSHLQRSFISDRKSS